MLKYIFLIYVGLLACTYVIANSETLKSESNLKMKEIGEYKYVERYPGYTIYRKVCEITKWCYLKRLDDKKSKKKRVKKNKCVFDDTKMQQRMNTFLIAAKETSAVKECKRPKFACIEFPCDILQYLASYGQYNVNKLGSFSTKPTGVGKFSLLNRSTKHLDANTSKLSAYALNFRDPFWRFQWYMHDYRTTKMPVMDHNIVPVLNKGITGLKVTIAIISDGVRKHPDLGNNYDKLISYDFCENKQGSSPHVMWKITRMSYDNVGTSSAGVIAMKSDNTLCGVGVAPNARIAGYRVDGCDTMQYELADLHEIALTFQLKIIDIYCNLYLRRDFSYHMFIGMTPGVADAHKKGAHQGRNGLGAIYIMPSGGNRDGNNCATNGYNNNPYVITIASANQHGKPASYSERCTAVFATAYSGDHHTEGIVSIHADGRCKKSFNGRPAGPAIASGIIALLLEAKPDLSYRDVMHIIAMTAEVAPLANNVGTWYRNGGGFWVSSDFGFGLMNAENMVTLAENWTPVEKKNLCQIRKKFYEQPFFDHVKKQIFTIDASICKGTESGISYLEHVELEITVESNYRGAVTMNITSPSGTNSTLLEARPKDSSADGYKSWTIMSVHNWGENPKGMWKIKFATVKDLGPTVPHGTVDEIIFTLHGVRERPVIPPRVYAPFRLPKRRLRDLLDLLGINPEYSFSLIK